MRKTVRKEAYRAALIVMAVYACITVLLQVFHLYKERSYFNEGVEEIVSAINNAEESFLERCELKEEFE